MPAETEFTEWNSEFGRPRSLSARKELRLALCHLQRNSMYAEFGDEVGVAETGYGHCLMTRGSISDPTELTYYRYHAPHDTTLTTLPQLTGHRWTVEECFPRAKKEAGLVHCQIRS